MAYGQKTGGRQKGTPNVLTTKTRELLTQIILEQIAMGRIQEELRLLHGRDYLNFILKLSNLVLPKAKEAEEEPPVPQTPVAKTAPAPQPDDDEMSKEEVKDMYRRGEDYVKSGQSFNPPTWKNVEKEYGPWDDDADPYDLSPIELVVENRMKDNKKLAQDFETYRIGRYVRYNENKDFKEALHDFNTLRKNLGMQPMHLEDDGDWGAKYGIRKPVASGQ